MNFDNNLIDKDTPIIQLEKSTLTKKEKKLIFGDTKNYSKKSLNHYLNMIYFYQNRYMYFKEKISMDELLGTYIAKKIGLKADTVEEGINSLITKIQEMNEKLNIPKSFKDAGIDETEFTAKVDLIADRAFEDQCTTANPRVPLVSEMKQILIDSYYGNEVK